MNFGSEKDFEIAIAELKWIEKLKGRTSESDFQQVAQKHSFPIEFLKAGLKGLEFPRDYIVSQSKWFPIVYAWNKDSLVLTQEYFRLRVNRIFWGALCISAFIAVPSVAVEMALSLLYTGIAIQNVLTWSILPTISIGASIILWLANRRADAISKWETFMSKFESEVPRKDEFSITVSLINQFISKNLILSMILAKRHSSNIHHLVLYRLGDTKISISPKTRASRIKRLLSSLLFRSQRMQSESELETLPIYFAEDPDLEYSKRIGSVLAET